MMALQPSFLRMKQGATLEKFMFHDDFQGELVVDDAFVGSFLVVYFLSQFEVIQLDFY